MNAQEAAERIAGLLEHSVGGEDSWTLDELDTALAHARQVPLTDQVRIHGDQANAFARRFRAIASRV